MKIRPSLTIAGALAVGAAILVGTVSPAAAHDHDETNCNGDTDGMTIRPYAAPVRIDVYPERLVTDFGVDGVDLVKIDWEPGWSRSFLVATDHLDGKEPNATIVIHEGVEVLNICTAGGNDYIDARDSGNEDGIFIDSGSGSDTVHGSKYDDTINGGGGNDDLFGHSGDDTINAGIGSTDTIDGGTGFDTCTIPASLILGHFPNCERALEPTSRATAP